MPLRKKVIWKKKKKKLRRKSRMDDRKGWKRYLRDYERPGYKRKNMKRVARAIERVTEAYVLSFSSVSSTYTHIYTHTHIHDSIMLISRTCLCTLYVRTRIHVTKSLVFERWSVKRLYDGNTWYHAVELFFLCFRIWHTEGVTRSSLASLYHVQANVTNIFVEIFIEIFLIYDPWLGEMQDSEKRFFKTVFTLNDIFLFSDKMFAH